ncbi:hypothetical protein HDU76_003183 [Blyttiomyces sp. JEL0837]|nr:hypothetical protein HDU76_003183 [Blyttiomyces sp. JEL0837]
MTGEQDDAYLVEERRLSKLMDEFLSLRNLAMDCYLSDKISENQDAWVPISLFAAPSRLGNLAHDEVVVAKAVRQNSNRLEVSDDGKQVRRKLGLELNEPVLDDEKIVYMEHLPTHATPAWINSHFTHLDIAATVHVPLVVRLKQQNFSNLDSEQVHDKVPPTFRLPGYAFVEFDTTDVANEVISLFGTKCRSFHTGDDLKACLAEGEESQQSEFDHVRIMPLKQWRRLTEQYLAVLQQRREQLQNVMKGRSGSHDQARFEAGVVGHFTGVHKDTNAKVLKHVFEMVASVTYVDHRRGETKGHVRFKTPHGAALAALFFGREHITQTHKNDTGRLLSAAEQKKRRKSGHQEEKTKPALAQSSDLKDFVGGGEWMDWDVEDETEGVQQEEKHLTTKKPSNSVIKSGIKLRILTGREEHKYWEEIRSKQHKTASLHTANHSLDSRPRHDEPTAPRVAPTRVKHPKRKREHIKFDDEDEEADEEKESRVSEPVEATETGPGTDDVKAKRKRVRTRRRGRKPAAESNEREQNGDDNV